MVFLFRIPADNVSDSVFLSTHHLNLMDKIISYIIQMNSNLLSLNFRVSNIRASNSEVSDSEVSDSKISNLDSSPWSQIRDLVSEAQGLGCSWALTFLGLDLSWWTMEIPVDSWPNILLLFFITILHLLHQNLELHIELVLRLMSIVDEFLVL